MWTVKEGIKKKACLSAVPSSLLIYSRIPPATFSRIRLICAVWLPCVARALRNLRSPSGITATAQRLQVEIHTRKEAPCSKTRDSTTLRHVDSTDCTTPPPTSFGSVRESQSRRSVDSTDLRPEPPPSTFLGVCVHMVFCLVQPGHTE